MGSWLMVIGLLTGELGRTVYPIPPGQMPLNLAVPGGGHLSQRGPQALPTLQQQSCLLSWVDTGCKHCLPELTKRKQAPFSSGMAGVLDMQVVSVESGTKPGLHVHL